MNARRILLTVACIMMPLLLQGPAVEADGIEERPRVIVHITRAKQVPGHVEYEDDSVLVVESLAGIHESWSKSQLLDILRLKDLPTPQRGTVILRSGKNRKGLIVRDDFDQVEILVSEIPIVMDRSEVSHIVLDPTFEEQYVDRKLLSRNGGIHAQLALCQWLINEREYDLARIELDEADMSQADGDAARKFRSLNAQLKLHTAKSDRTEPGTSPDKKKNNTTPRLLTFEEVNLVRVYEIDMTNPPRVLVPRDVIEELISRHGTSDLIPDTEAEQADLYRADSIEIVKIMFRLRARDLYDRIEVISEPVSLKLFRERVHDSWLNNNCSTNRCHGGADSGRLRLRRDALTSERSCYTNLIVLERFRTSDGMPIIDWERPARSLLLQYGLPRSETMTPHPDVPGWTPVFDTRHRELMDNSIGWMNSMKTTPRPQYPIPDLSPRNTEAEGP